MSLKFLNGAGRSEIDLRAICVVEPEVVRIPPNDDELVVGVEDIASDSLSRRRGRVGQEEGQEEG